MKRHQWEFQYSAEVVANAAKKKVELHQSRLEYWTQQMKEAMEALKGSVEVREYDQGYHNITNKLSADNLQIVGDPEKQRRYSKCISKMQQHMDKVEEYIGYEATLRAQTSTTPRVCVPLNVDDIIFFGLTNLEEKEEDE